MARKTVVVFNQVDTVDTSTVFTGEGFYGTYQKTKELLRQSGIPPENILMSCARLPFLVKLLEQSIERDESNSIQIQPRIDRLKQVLFKLHKRCSDRSADEFTGKIQSACDPGHAGLEIVRNALNELGRVCLREHQVKN